MSELQCPDHRLADYLAWALDAQVPQSELRSRLLPGGVHENLYVEAKVAGSSRRFVVRHQPQASRLGHERTVQPYDLKLQFDVLRDLEHVNALVTPRVWGLDVEGTWRGKPAYVMEYITGEDLLSATRASSDVLEGFARTIATMNAVPPADVPSLVQAHGWPDEKPVDLLGWITSQIGDLRVPPWFARALDILAAGPPAPRPARVFGNGDLNPSNFIVQADGSIAVVDWEYVGYCDPLNELMLLHVWPRERPFLDQYPLDRLYCRITGTDERLLPWYELCAALTGWVYATRNENQVDQCISERRVATLVKR